MYLCGYFLIFFAQSTHIHVKSYVSEKHAKHLTPIFALFCTSFVKHIQYPLANKDSSKNSTIKIYGIRLGYAAFLLAPLGFSVEVWCLHSLGEDAVFPHNSDGILIPLQAHTD